MALMPNKHEMALLREEALRKKKTESQRKKRFIKKWVFASGTLLSGLAEQQAKILWDIIIRLENVERDSGEAKLHNMRF